ncbi:hypothetical protein WG899_20470 [Paucibacter sp. AS339]
MSSNTHLQFKPTLRSRLAMAGGLFVGMVELLALLRARRDRAA